MWGVSCVALACVGLMFFGVRTAFTVLPASSFLGVCWTLSPWWGVTGVVVIRACLVIEWVLLFALWVPVPCQGLDLLPWLLEWKPPGLPLSLAVPGR